MVTINIVSLIIVIFITIASVDLSNAATVNCTTLNQTTCCETSECFFLNCTEKTNASLTHQGCHANENRITVINATCVNQTDSNLCKKPDPEPQCSEYSNQTECCGPDHGCIWTEDCKVKKEVTKGCFNASEINVKCALPYTDKCSPAPALTCANFTTNQVECCNQTQLGCVYVNCTGSDKTNYTGCFEKGQPKCSPLVDICKAHTTTTAAPVTTSTPLPPFKGCEQFTSSSDCCGSDTYKCIFVNCTQAKVEGCFSLANKSDVVTQCGSGYLDACNATIPTSTQAPTTSVAPSTPATPGRHFDGASFIGGIVLCAGLLVIIFFAVKFYRSRQASNNYHQM